MIENLKNLLNAKNLLIITVSLIICYIFFNIFLYENFGEEDTTVSTSVYPSPKLSKKPIMRVRVPPQTQTL